MRTLATAASTALQQRAVAMALLVEFGFTSSVYVTSWGAALEFGGVTYGSIGQLGSMEPAQEAGGTPQGVRFTLTGVAASQVALALAEPVQGAAVSVRVAVLDVDTAQVLDAPLEWVGTCDTMTLSEDAGTATITVTAEHAGVDLLRAVPVRYSDTDQQRLHPGDLGFQYVTDQADRTIVWPARSYFLR